MNGCRAKIQTGKATERDHAIRALGYLKACEQTGIHPRDWMLSQLPILPPKFRPVSKTTDSEVPLIDDANYLYKLMIDTNNGVKELRKFTRDTAKEEYGIYDAYKQVTGLTEPVHPKLVQIIKALSPSQNTVIKKLRRQMVTCACNFRRSEESGSRCWHS